jgi:glycosyltransferase involved in cell wall biosynthesis
MLDVVIPARSEHAGSLAKCLGALLRERSTLDLRIVVVANGPDRAATAVAARKLLPSFGEALEVLETSELGKTSALNVGEQGWRGGPIVYLDADIVLAAGTLSGLAASLGGELPCFAAPRRIVVPSRNWMTRAYTRLWERLPAVTADVGAGCYGVNASGRARWDLFPEVLADDAYVRTRFAASERVISNFGGAVVAMPEGMDLVRTVRRWRSGNQQLRALKGPSADLRGGLFNNLAFLCRHPDLWPDLPAFAAITMAARFWRGPRSNNWSPARSPMERGRLAGG